MTNLGSEQVMIDQWIEGRLADPATVALLEQISVGLGSRVFNAYAPNGTPYPFIVYQCQSPVRDVRGVGVARVMVDTLYIVKAVSQVVSYSPLAPVARVIDAAMTSPDTSTATDGLVLVSVRSEQFSLTEVAAGKQVRNLGGMYHIQAQTL